LWTVAGKACGQAIYLLEPKGVADALRMA